MSKDYSITWRYIVDEMESRYGINPNDEENYAFGEIISLLNEIWKDYFLTLYKAEQRKEE